MVDIVRDGLGSSFLLFAEDDSTQTALLTLACQRAGLHPCEFFICRDGAQLVAFLERTGPPHERLPLPTRIVTDLRMPLMDGFGALEWLRSRSAFAGVPVTLFSSGVTSEIRERAEALGASEVVEKCMSLPQLIQQIQHWANPSRLSWFVHAPNQRWLFDEIS